MLVADTEGERRGETDEGEGSSVGEAEAEADGGGGRDDRGRCLRRVVHRTRLGSAGAIVIVDVVVADGWGSAVGWERGTATEPCAPLANVTRVTIMIKLVSYRN